MNTVSLPNELLLEETHRLIADGHTVTHLVRGNSMNPFLVDRRDKVVIGSFADEELKRGVVVLARDTTGRYVLHRIISRKDDELTLMGDGNIRGKETAYTAEVIGIVREMIRKGKKYDCQAQSWLWYSKIWMRIKPVRRYLLGIWRRLFM